MLNYIQYPHWLHPEIIPGLPFRWYGLMYLVAFTISYLLIRYQVRKNQIPVDNDVVLNLIFWAIIGLVVGARLLSVIVYDPEGYYLQHPLEIILPFSRINGRWVFTGILGLSYHGGLIGAIIACVIYLKAKKLAVLEWADMIIASVPLGYTFGRLGNFINGELYGRVTTAPWGMLFPQAKEFSTQWEWVRNVAREVGLQLTGLTTINLPRHPSQLYEAFFEGLLLWIVLWFILKPRRPYKGFLLGAYLIGYGIARFIIEYFRLPDADIGYPIQLVPIEHPDYQYSLFNFTTGQILCTLMILAGIFFLLNRKHAVSRETIQENVKEEKRSARKLRKRIR